jgi:ribokinase
MIAGTIPHIVVIGSVNMDLMVHCPHLPTPGETVLGREFLQSPGGKGSNQAVAASRLGAKVYFVGCAGDDTFGHESRDRLEADGVNIGHLQLIRGAVTGVAIVMTDHAGENCIALAPGANNALTCQHIDAAEEIIASASVVVCQFESPLQTVLHAIKVAKRNKVPFLLNPAPVREIELRKLSGVDLLILNSVEAASLSGLLVVSPQEATVAAGILRGLGIPKVIITLGKDGAVVSEGASTSYHPAPLVRAVDSTGAGDTFVGAIAAGLASGYAMNDAVAFAQHAAAYSVTQRGAQASMPRVADLAHLRASHLEPI